MALTWELLIALVLQLLFLQSTVISANVDCLPSDNNFCRCSTSNITLDITNIMGLSFPALTFQDNGKYNIAFTPCHVQPCGNYSNGALCQLDTEIMEYYSLGTYTNFQWIITDFNPLEFVIHYDGGTEAFGTRRQSFVYFKKGNGPTNFTFVNEEHPVIYHFEVSGSGVDSVQGIPPPTNVGAVQEGLTSIIVSWTPSSNATGYRIYYDSSGGHSGFEDVTNGSFDNYTLKGVQNGTPYTIFIMATSEDHPPSTLVELNIYLISPPGEILLAVLSATPTSISLSWSIASSSATGWEVVWRDSNGNVTENTSGSLSGTNYTINDLLTTTSYSVRVRAVNAIGPTETPHIISVTSNFSSTSLPPTPVSSIISVTSNISSMNMTSLPPTPVYDSCPQMNTSSTSCSGRDDNVTSISTGAVGVVLLSLLALSVSVNVVMVLKRSNKAPPCTSEKIRSDAEVPGSENSELQANTSEDLTYENPYDIM